MTTQFRLAVAVIATSLASFVAGAAIVDQFTGPVYYVDPANPNAGDGSTANPFRSIQSAVTAAEAGSTIQLSAGVFDRDAISETLGGVATLSRVVLTKKLYLKGAGRDLTFLVGTEASTSEKDGLGTDAVRGILATDAAAGSIVEGLTIRGGRTLLCDQTQVINDSTKPNIRERYTAATNQLAFAGGNLAACGGGLYFTGTSRADADLMTMVDCSVEDCRAGFSGAAVYGNVRLVRCYVARCYTPTLQGGVIARVPVAFSSVFAGNGQTLYDCADSIHASPASFTSDYLETVCVNCTFNGNLGVGVPFAQTSKFVDVTVANVASIQRFQFYNCIFWTHGLGQRYVNGNVECYNCCQNKYGSLKNVLVDVLDAEGRPIPRLDNSSVNYKTNSIGNIGSDHYPRLYEDREGTTSASSPSKAGSGAEAYCPPIPFGLKQFVGGYGRDVRLREGSYLINRGDTKWFTTSNKIPSMPAEYLDKDFYGKARIQDGQVDQGAAEGGYEQGTVYTVSIANRTVLVNGCPHNSIFDGLAISGVPGSELEIGLVLNPNEELYGFVPATLKMNSSAYSTQRYAFPNFRGRSATIRVERASRCATETYSAIVAKSVKWVSPDGSDSNAGTESAPYRTLQKAVDASTSQGVVLAKPGVYDEGGVNNSSGVCDSDWALGTGNRVKIGKHLRLVGVGGAEKTIIMGQATTATPEQVANGEEVVNSGCGVGAKRCIGIVKGAYVQVQGFTLTGGHTDSDPVGKNHIYQVAGNKTLKTGDNTGCYNWGGGAVCGGTSNYHAGYDYAFIDDCIISNNTAYVGAAMVACFARRCVITGNHTVDVTQDRNAETGELQKIWNAFFLTHFTSLSHCLVYDNDINGDYLCSGDVYNSFYNNIFSDANHSPIQLGKVYNNVFSACRTVGNLSGAGNIVWPEVATWTAAGSHLTADPLCVRDSNGRPRIARNSPALTCGVGDTTATDAFGYVHTGPGLDGFKCLHGMTGVQPAGCYYGDYITGVIRVVAGENMARETVGLEPQVDLAFEHPWDASDVVFTATDPRKLEGFRVNGVLVPASGRTFTWDPSMGGMTIAPVYAAAQDWYVDAAQIDDTGDGLTAATAKRTLNGAFEYAWSGDTVHVAEGVYSDNAQLSASTEHIACVGVVPAGVTLLADGACDRTVIEGRWGTTKINLNHQNIDFGLDAVRCLAARANTRIKGFTLRNGGTSVTGIDGSVANDLIGAGVLGTSTTTYEDCCFTNLCSSTEAAFSGGGTAIRCRFIRCGTASNNVTLGAKHYNCYIDWSFDALFASAKVIKNCTIGPNNRIGFTSSTSYPGTPISTASDGVVENTLVLVPNKSSTTTGSLKGVRYCVFHPSLANRYGATTWGEHVRFMDANEAKLGADGRLMSGSPAIDAGLNASLEEGKTADVDVAGGQRIYNGIVDIGAFEYDWRGDFAKMLLSSTRFSVTQADPQVVRTDAGKILVRSGTLGTCWTSAGCRFANFQVTGAGTLTVTQGEDVQTFTAADGAVRLRLAAGNDISFAYAKAETDTDAMGALLSRFEDVSGTMLIFR